MTNREFFVHTLKDEKNRFKKVLEALPDDKQSHKVHDRSREAGNIATQLAIQWASVSDIIKNGNITWDESAMKPRSGKELISDFEKNYDQMLADLEKISDSDWENSDASMGPDWKTKKYDMAWGFLFDAIHHRGQLSTFLRSMGGKVPAVYGPSADAQL